MSTYDSTGVSMDRYATILAQMIALAEAWKGKSLSTDEKHTFGHILRQMAYQSYGANQKVQALYDALGVSNNSGVPLDNILELIGMERQSAAKSTATVTCTVSKACTIPAGSTVRTSARLNWTTDNALVFSAAGSEDVGVTCTEYGPNDAGINEINTIVTAVNGWTSVTNSDVAIPGRLQETDAELKTRHTTAVATSGDRDASSIAEAVGSVDGVSATLVVEDYDADEVSVYVIGGDDDEIAAAMDAQVTIGIGPILSGTTSVDVYDAVLKQARTMKFTYGSNVNIYVDMTIQTTGLFPTDGDNQIKSAIEALFDGNTLGDDLLYDQVIAAIYTVPGCIKQYLYIGTSPSPAGTSDISISNAQRAVIDTANISILHV